MTQFEPANPFEEFLVDQLVACLWRMNRMQSFESATVNGQMERQSDTSDPVTCASLAYGSLLESTGALAACYRFESAQSRQYARALRQLTEVQSKRESKKNRNSNPIPKMNSSPCSAESASRAALPCSVV
jgi:hypothetical protein